MSVVGHSGLMPANFTTPGISFTYRRLRETRSEAPLSWSAATALDARRDGLRPPAGRCPSTALAAEKKVAGTGNQLGVGDRVNTPILNLGKGGTEAHQF